MVSTMDRGVFGEAAGDIDAWLRER